MSERELPSPELLRQLFRYEPETGKLFWNYRDGEVKWWNTRYANQEAFKPIDADGYKKGRVLGHNCISHRVIWVMVYGEWPNCQIDHINGDRTDNRIVNLRAVSREENARNRKVPKNSSTGIIGVTKEGGKWRAHIRIGGKKINLGRFENFDDAVCARKKANAHYNFHENHGNR